MLYNIDWKKYFDLIYCIHYLPKHDERFERIHNLLKNIGILDSGIFRWKFTFDSPIYEVILKNTTHHHNAPKTSINMFKCMLAHYEVIKDAKCFKYNRILILEEDIVFNNNAESVVNTLDNIPSTNIVMLDKFCYDHLGFLNNVNDPNFFINEYYRKFDRTCTNYGSGACYSLDKFAIEKFIEIYEDGWQCPDGIWNEDCSSCMTKSFALENIAILKSFNTSNSKLVFDMDLAYKFACVDVKNYG